MSARRPSPAFDLRRRRALRAGLAALALLPGWRVPARAQPADAVFPRPGQPIRIVVPFPAGGTSDLRARQVAERLRADAGWNMVVDNKPGASGQIGSAEVARAAADGHTLLLGTIGTLAINPALFPKQPYEVLRDFQPVTQFSRSVSVLFAHRELGLRTMAELDARLRAGAKLAWASPGNGTIGHMVGAMICRAWGWDMVHVPYKGTAPALQDFLARQVPLLIDTPSALWEHWRAGTALALASTSAERSPLLPQVPTLAELGHKDLVFDTWQGIVAPRGLPSAVLAALHREITRALRHPEVQRSHEEQLNTVVANRPEEFEAFIAAETARWARVVRDTGVTAG
jgi:tripartite-type tricarboxylate transporter receptor subunit TctC